MVLIPVVSLKTKAAVRETPATDWSGQVCKLGLAPSVARKKKLPLAPKALSYSSSSYLFTHLWKHEETGKRRRDGAMH